MNVIEHEQLPPSDRGQKMVGAYAVAIPKDGSPPVWEFMWAEDIEKIKKVSKSAQSKDSPWKNWESEMWKKTVIRRLATKRLRLRAEEKAAVRRDEVIDLGPEDYSIIDEDPGAETASATAKKTEELKNRLPQAKKEEPLAEAAQPSSGPSEPPPPEKTVEEEFGGAETPPSEPPEQAAGGAEDAKQRQKGDELREDAQKLYLSEINKALTHKKIDDILHSAYVDGIEGEDYKALERAAGLRRSEIGPGELC
jgi:hypothetical protein